MLYKTSQWTFSVKNLKPSSSRKYLVLTLKYRRNPVRSDSPSGHQNTIYPVPKSLFKTLKFLYVIATNVSNNFCEGNILKLGLEKFIKIQTDLKVGGTVNRTVLWWSENRLPNDPKQLPKIMNLKYVTLKDFGNKFHEEHFLRFGPQWSPKKITKRRGTVTTRNLKIIKLVLLSKSSLYNH